MGETNLCKACYGKKKYSIYTGYTRSWDFPWDKPGMIDRQENKTCPRCNGTGEEPDGVFGNVGNTSMKELLDMGRNDVHQEYTKDKQIVVLGGKVF